MYSAPISLPDGQEDFRRAVQTELTQLSSILQAIGAGQTYPHSPSLGKTQMWADLVVPLHSALPGATPPTASTLRDGIMAYAFSAGTTNDVHVAIHVGHDIRRNTKLYPFIQWTASAGVGDVVWGLEWVIAKSYGVGNFGSSTTIYKTQSMGGPFVNNFCEFADSDAIASGIEPGSVLLMRVFRVGGHASDTLPDPAFGLCVGVHYLRGYWASKNRSPDFYE